MSTSARSVHLLRPAVCGYIVPIETGWTERHECTRCGWVTHRVRAGASPYRVRLTRRSRQPGLFVANQPERATLVHERVLEALRTAGLDSGLEIVPAFVEPYRAAYFAVWSRVRLRMVSTGTRPGAAGVDCDLCGGCWTLPEPDRPSVFRGPPPATHWCETNLAREPSMSLAASDEVRTFLGSDAVRDLLRPTAEFPVPEWTAATVLPQSSTTGASTGRDPRTLPAKDKV